MDFMLLIFWIPQMCLQVTYLYHFHDMIDMLVKCGYKKGTTLFGYRYNFRQSNSIDQSINGLKEKLAAGYIYDSLATGLQFVEGLESYFFVSRWSMHKLLVECSSIYGMLPNPDFQWKKQPGIFVWKKRSENGQEF
ncbi:hypothetical protein LXL04_004762 [Taraxacum kok-saghyz]